MTEEVERVTSTAAPNPVPKTTRNERAKYPKKVAVRRAGDATRKAKLLEALREAKESLRCSAVPPAGEASISPKEPESKDQEHADKRPDVFPQPVCPTIAAWAEHQYIAETNLPFSMFSCASMITYR